MQLQEGPKIRPETVVIAMNRDDHNSRLPSLDKLPAGAETSAELVFIPPTADQPSSSGKERSTRSI
jgi:hypothetical protein